MHREANLIGWFSDDLHIDDGGHCGSLAGVAGICERFGDERESAPRELQDRHGPTAVLHAGGLCLENKRSAIGVDHDLTFASLHLLAGIVAAWAAAFGGLDALAVENGCCGGEASRPTRSRSAITR